MKKIIFILFISIFVLIVTKEDYVVVPNESFRFRVMPNSNSVEDIFIKEKVLENVIKEINVEEDLLQTKENIKNSLDKIKTTVEKTLNKYNYNQDFVVSYGNNYFPKKVYKDVIYPEGNYDSLVIKLGEGKGSNFWCVLFPPLCMMENEEDTRDIEYKFKIQEIIESFLNNK